MHTPLYLPIPSPALLCCPSVHLMISCLNTHKYIVNTIQGGRYLSSASIPSTTVSDNASDACNRLLLCLNPLFSSPTNRYSTVKESGSTQSTIFSEAEQESHCVQCPGRKSTVNNELQTNLDEIAPTSWFHRRRKHNVREVHRDDVLYPWERSYPQPERNTQKFMIFVLQHAQYCRKIYLIDTAKLLRTTSPTSTA